MKNLANSIVRLLALLVLVFGACTKGKFKEETASESHSDSTAKSEDFNSNLRIKDAHQYYTLRGDIPQEAFIEIVINKPELLSAGSTFRIQYNPLPIYGGQNNALITIDSFSFSATTSSYLRPINQSPTGFYLIEHPDLGRYEALVTDSTTVQFHQGKGKELELANEGATLDYYDLVMTIQQVSAAQDMDDFYGSYPIIIEAARAAHATKPDNVYLDVFMALFDRMDEANAKDIQSIMNRLNNIDYERALMAYLNVPYDIAIPDTSGQPISISDYSGKVVLIDFWASWCAPCRQENPNLVRLHKKYNRQGFDILSISLDNVRSRWFQAIKDDNLYWEGHCSDLNGWNTEIVNMYNIQGIPTSFLIGRNGLMIWNSNNPQLSLEEAIVEAL
ncbi:MAG: TlpA disulfide reductase family protein [Bacteroidota bacterium]|nr:TlpA disulfide reductase family protein [Bacteroidota bacterium]